MTQTDAEDGLREGPFDSSVGQGHRQWSIGWLAWPRTEDDVRWIRGEHILDSVRQRPSTRGDPDIPARACEEIRDVPGEGIEIVHQNDPILHRHSVDSSDLPTSGRSTRQQAVNCERPTLHLRGCILLQPAARLKDAAFHSVSSASRLASESMTIPPPASTRPNQCPSSSLASSVRIRMLQCVDHRCEGLDPSRHPVQNPLGAASTASMMAVAVSFGHPADAPAREQGIEHFAW